MTSEQANKKLRFLCLTSDIYPPFRVDLTVLFGKEVSSRGHEIDWLFQYGEPGYQSRCTRWAGGEAWVVKTSFGNIYKKMYKHILNLMNDLRVFSLPRKRKYQFIQVKDKFFSSLIALWASKIYGLPLVYWLSYPFPEAWIQEGKERTAIHSIFILRLIRGFISRLLLYKIILPLAEHIFVQSEQMKTDVAQEGIPKEKMTVVPMGISQEQIDNLSELIKLNNGKDKIVLYLGKFFKIRKLEFLIRMFQRVLEDVPDAKFYFIGNGEDSSVDQMLKDEAKKLKIEEHIVFTGYLPLNDALEYVRKARVCVSSYYPTFVLNSTSPTKVIEYMAMGKAVVGNDHPEQKLLITESGGGICVPYDENEFAKAVVKLLQNPEMAAEMGQRGKLYVLKHRTYPVIADILEQAYEKIL